MENTIPTVIEGKCNVKPKGTRKTGESGKEVWYTIKDCDAINNGQLMQIVKKGVVVPLQSLLRERFPNGNFPLTFAVSIHEIFDPSCESAKKGGPAAILKAKNDKLANENAALAERLAKLEAQLAQVQS
jgi:hypothetical protein